MVLFARRLPPNGTMTTILVAGLVAARIAFSQLVTATVTPCIVQFPANVGATQAWSLNLIFTQNTWHDKSTLAIHVVYWSMALYPWLLKT